MTVSYVPVAASAVSRARECASCAAQVLPRNRLLALHNLLRRALRHHIAAVDARAGADVDDVVGRAHGLLVVLHHDERVAQVPQALERVEQLVGCLSGAGRWRARREYRAHPSATSRSAWPDGCAGSRRPTAWPPPRDSVRYSSPTFCRKLQALANFLQNLVVQSCSSRWARAPACRESRSACVMDISVKSMMFTPPTVTASTSCFRRLPWQSGQGCWSSWSLRISERINSRIGLAVAALKIVGNRPQKSV